MNIVAKVKKHGFSGSVKITFGLISRKIRNAYCRWAVRQAPKFNNPNCSEIDQIGLDLQSIGIMVQDYSPSIENFYAFHAAHYFPNDYHGGINGPVWDEKLLEHWIATELLGLMSYKPTDTYIDVAAGGSPWAKVLRERLGINAFAIDMSEVSANGTYLGIPHGLSA